MHARRLACFILGMWLAAGITVAWLERADFQTIQDVLSQPDPAVAERVKALGAHEAYLLMGHVASEQRQRTIRSWEDVQLFWASGFSSSCCSARAKASYRWRWPCCWWGWCCWNGFC